MIKIQIKKEREKSALEKLRHLSEIQLETQESKEDDYICAWNQNLSVDKGPRQSIKSIDIKVNSPIPKVMQTIKPRYRKPFFEHGIMFQQQQKATSYHQQAPLNINQFLTLDQVTIGRRYFIPSADTSNPIIFNFKGNITQNKFKKRKPCLNSQIENFSFHEKAFVSSKNKVCSPLLERANNYCRLNQKFHLKELILNKILNFKKNGHINKKLKSHSAQEVKQLPNIRNQIIGQQIPKKKCQF